MRVATAVIGSRHSKKRIRHCECRQHHIIAGEAVVRPNRTAFAHSQEDGWSIAGGKSSKLHDIAVAFCDHEGVRRGIVGHEP
jgi:hypothetical protein